MKLTINLWDDYRQKPQYQWNETTTLTIDQYQKLEKGDIYEIREKLLEHCEDWKKQNPGKVCFSRGILPWKLDVIELDEKSRKSLYDYLKKNFTKCGDEFKIQMLMES